MENVIGLSREQDYSLSDYGGPSPEDIKEMEFWIKTGGVHNSYLEKVLGDQSVGVGVFLNDKIKSRENALS